MHDHVILSNLVLHRCLVIECIEDAKTPKGDCMWGGNSDDLAMRASKMNLEEVLRILQRRKAYGLTVLTGLNEDGITLGIIWPSKRKRRAKCRQIVRRV